LDITGFVLPVVVLIYLLVSLLRGDSKWDGDQFTDTNKWG